MQTNTTTAGQAISNADAVNAAIAAINNQPTHKPGVPTAIHFICVLTALGAGISVISLLVLGPFMGTKFYIYNFAVLIGNVLAIIWMWQMKKKGAYLYASLFVVSQVFLWGSDSFGIYLYSVLDFLMGMVLSGSDTSPEMIISIFSAIPTAIVLFYSRRMR